MLEHIPAWLGAAIGGLRAGADKLAIVQTGVHGGGQIGGEFATLDLTSPAFAHEARLPPRFTADGEGVSPPLAWPAPPVGTDRMVLIVEDADAPTPQPLVHAILWGIEPGAGALAEGAIVANGDGGGAGDADGRDVGRNSYLREGWLPPDPPRGHGEHRYVFQLFAIGAGAGDPGETPGRAAVLDAIAGHVLAAGVLIGTYSRADAAPVGPVGMTAPA